MIWTLLAHLHISFAIQINCILYSVLGKSKVGFAE